MSSRQAALDAFAAMPLTLKGTTSFFVVFGVGSLVVAALPGLEHRVGGETLGQGELFASGYGAFAIGTGLTLGLAAAGLLRRARWAIPLTAAAYIPLALGDAWFAAEPRILWQSACALAWALGSGAYLLGTRGSQAYFDASP